jgi:hypothetical protein
MKRSSPKPDTSATHFERDTIGLRFGELDELAQSADV